MDLNATMLQGRSLWISIAASTLERASVREDLSNTAVPRLVRKGRGKEEVEEEGQETASDEEKSDWEGCE